MASPRKDFFSIEHPHCYSNPSPYPARGKSAKIGTQRSTEHDGEGILVLSAQYRQPRGDRGGNGGHAARPLSAHAAGTERADQTGRRTRLRLGQLHRTSFPYRGLRGFAEPGAARPVFRDADQTHPRRATGHRLAGRQPDPGGRGHRDAGPHDRRPRGGGLRARLSAPLGRYHGATDARRQRRSAAPARCDRRRQPRRVRGELPDHQKGLDRGDADLRRAILEGAGAARRPGRSIRPRNMARAWRTACSVRSAWCRNRCKSRTPICSCRSPHRKTPSGGPRRRV